MKEISEFTLLGNYLVMFYDNLGADSIKYETAKNLTESIFTKLNSKTQNYELLPMKKKMDIVKDMISKGVFRTDSSNKATPFKQVYNYEISKNIFAVYSCDGNLTFKFPSSQTAEKDQLVNLTRQTYCQNMNLDMQNAIKAEICAIKQKSKTPKLKSKE